MARLACKSLLLVALVAIVAGLIVMGPAGQDVVGDTYLAAWRDKHQRLVGPGHDRLLLTGGSNLAFGVDSSRLHAVTDRETINLGLHGGLGLALMVHEVEDGARAGDLVVLIPEYEHFYGDVMNGQLPAAEVLHANWSALPYFSSWGQWRGLIKNAPIITSATALARLEQLKIVLHRRPSHDPDMRTVYRRHAFDSNGDLVGNSDRESLPDRVAASNERIRGPFNQEAIEEIARCAERLSARGVAFIVVFPAVSASYWSLNQDLARQVAARMSNQWTLTKPEDWIFDDWLFYDSSYHLNQSGREARTQQLARVLRPEQVDRR